MRSAAFDTVSNAYADPVLEVVAAPDSQVPYLDRTDLELKALDLFGDVARDAAAARYIPSQDRVEVTLWTQNPDATSKSANEITANAHESRAMGSVDLSVTVNTGSVPSEQVEGGEAYGVCTGGFIGYRSGVPGIITAAHCTSKPAGYDGATTGSSYTASSNYDSRFTALSGGTPQNLVRAGTSTYSMISAAGVVSPGMNIAKYGSTTGYGTTTVKEYVGCLTFPSSGNTWCGLYRTNALITAGGDSGGPWFFINTAYATTTGGDSGSLITPIAYIAYISGGVSVKTS